ncbi:MAG: flagellar FlbD family protein [Clostridia bacterium]|nr:flagellar FlbD family protein [Clostridia bacterium]
MIQLTSLQGEKFFLSADLIERVEEIPDTMITLVNGKKLRVSEDADTVVDRYIEYKRKINGVMEVRHE